MGEVDAEVKQWGDSFAVIIPRQIVNEERLHVKDKIRLRVEKKIDISALFGIIKGKTKLTPQELKNAAKKGWD